MNPDTLADIERELIDVTDDIDHRDFDYEFNAQIDTLRSIARKIGVEVERLKASHHPRRSAAQADQLSGAGGVSFHASEVTQP